MKTVTSLRAVWAAIIAWLVAMSADHGSLDFEKAKAAAAVAIAYAAMADGDDEKPPAPPPPTPPAEECPCEGTGVWKPDGKIPQACPCGGAGKCQCKPKKRS